jgi:hypothetical protein
LYHPPLRRILGEASDPQGGDVARPLTPDELTRYPWASQISDYVPVGTLRAAGLLIGIAGVIVLLFGTIVSLAQAENIHHAVTMQHLPTVLGVYIGLVLTTVAAVIGVVTAVQGIAKRGAWSLLWWSAGAIAPVLLVVFVIRPLIH